MLFYQELEKHKDRTAIVDETRRRMTYGELLGFSRDLERYFNAPPRKLVVIQAQNNPESLAAYLAGLRSRSAVMLLNASLNPELLEQLIRAYQPDFLWRPAQTVKEAVFQKGHYELIALPQIKPSSPIHPDVKLLLSTSGSTGSPKMVKLSAVNLDVNARAIAQYLQLDGQERPITLLPMAYSYGLSVINSHWAAGSAILLTNASVIQKEFWGFLKEERSTSFAGVPGTYELLQRFGFFRMDLPNLRYITQAGGKLKPELVGKFAGHSREKGFHFFVMYGQTEATARMAYLPPEYNWSKSESVGIPIPGGRLQIEDENGREIRMPYRSGELTYQGPNVMLGYACERDDLTLGRTQGDVLKTGDTGYFDAEGFFYVTGRKDRYVKLLGHRLNLDEIETALQNRSYHCACGGKEDLLLVANLHPAHSGAIKTEIVRRYKLDPSLVRVVEVANIAKTLSGKINYQEIFQPYLENPNGIPDAK